MSKQQQCPECGNNLRVVGFEVSPKGADYVCQRHEPYLYFSQHLKRGKDPVTKAYRVDITLLQFDRRSDADLFPPDCP